jgi:hypothetical protein
LIFSCDVLPVNNAAKEGPIGEEYKCKYDAFLSNDQKTGST